MPRAPPQNLSRSFNTRCTGIFKKAAELHQIDDRVRISIIVEKPGVAPLVFTTEERGLNWPPFMEDYVRLFAVYRWLYSPSQVKRSHPFIKRPAHYQTVVEGISRGHVRIVRTSSASPPPPYLTGDTTNGKEGEKNVGESLGDTEVQESLPSYQLLGEAWALPTTPPRPIPSRTSTSSPLPTNVILPSKMTRNFE
jgi:hypothetical protein